MNETGRAIDLAGSSLQESWAIMAAVIRMKPDPGRRPAIAGRGGGREMKDHSAQGTGSVEFPARRQPCTVGGPPENGARLTPRIPVPVPELQTPVRGIPEAYTPPATPAGGPESR